MNSQEKTNLGILIFPDVEVLDFAGPFEVFSACNELNGDRLFNLFTLAGTRDTVRAKNGLQVVPDYDIENCPAPDCLVVPGGFGTRALLADERMMFRINASAEHCSHILSVCSGSLVLGRLGLLEGLEATTHHDIFDELEAAAPGAVIVRDRRFTDNGRILTSAGVAAGIDMCLYMLGRWFGSEQARATAEYIEYPYE